MLYRKLGKTEMEVSVIGFGCWPVGNDWTGASDENSIRVINKAVDCGINFFDVAPIYGFNHAEVVLGRALKGKRDKVYIASKCGLKWDESRTRVWRDLSKASVLQEIDDSLRRLDTDYIDLMQLHWHDINTPLSETYEALNEAKEKGKIRHIGVSNFSQILLEQAMQCGEVASNQVLYNMIDRNSDRYHELPLVYRTEDEILPFCEKHQIGVIPYSPLLQGLLAGNFERDKLIDRDARLPNPQLQGERLERNLRTAKKLQAVAEKYNRPMAQMALNWLIAKQAISTIIAAPITEAEVEQNVASLEWELTPEMLADIEQALS